jgi:hypothetical protein
MRNKAIGTYRMRSWRVRFRSGRDASLRISSSACKLHSDRLGDSGGRLLDWWGVVFVDKTRVWHCRSGGINGRSCRIRATLICTGWRRGGAKEVGVVVDTEVVEECLGGSGIRETSSDMLVTKTDYLCLQVHHGDQ